MRFFLLVLLYLIKASLIMDRWVRKMDSPKCLQLKNPRHDVMAVLLADRNLSKIFIDLGHDRINWLQILSKSRSLFEKLRYFDRNTSKTIYKNFVYPDGSTDPNVKSIQISTPADAHLYILLREYQPALKKLIFDNGDVYMRCCELPAKLEDIVVRMFGPECESSELYSDLDIYFESFLTDIGIK